VFYAVRASFIAMRSFFFFPDGAERPIFAKRMTLQIKAVTAFVAPNVMSISESSNSCLVHRVHKSVYILSAPKCLTITPVC